MAVVKCRECGHEVTAGDRTCHNCGAPAPADTSRSRRATRVVATIVFLVVLVAIFMIMR